LLGFTKLKEKLLDGTKTQTIRKPRKHPIKKGDKLFIYWKLRTKECEKLGEAIIRKIVRKKAEDFTQNDALRDGFSQDYFRTPLANLMQALHTMHGEFNEFKQEFDVITFEWTKKEF